MSKQTLIDEIAAQFPSKAAAERAIDAVVDGIKTVVTRGDPVIIQGFGTFEKKHHDARKGRNIRTNETLTIAARDVLKFKSKVKF